MLDLSRFKILVVDDEPDILRFIAAVLEDNGANVFTAENGIDALKSASIVLPDLITLDLEMPQMDGAQVFEKLRSDPELRNIPVFIISGKPELRRLLYKRSTIPPEGYLDKPIDESSLLRNVRKILSLKMRKEK